MFSTYRLEDVTILLKDITGLVEPLGTAEREKRIQGGCHYSEMLPLEYEPSEAYLAAYQDALNRFAGKTAKAVMRAAQRIWECKGEKVALVSLARAGTSIGVLLKHWLDKTYGVTVPHYTISIIRGRGIDRNALNHILSRHEGKYLQFVDGWTGKGAIQRELMKALEDCPEVDGKLAVLSDPAGVAGIRGTEEDILVASSCLNATVSGLLSRTFLRSDIIGPRDFHGAIFYRNLMEKDLTYSFLQAIERHFTKRVSREEPRTLSHGRGLAEAEEIARHFGVRDINLVKPGIGETTRVLLRRLPWKVLVRSKTDPEYLGHIYQLAKEKGVDVVEYPLQNYRACGIIRAIADQ